MNGYWNFRQIPKDRIQIANKQMGKKYYSSVKWKLNNSEIQLVRLAIMKKTNTIPKIAGKDEDKM